MRSFQPVGAGADITVFNLDISAHRFQTLDVQVHRPGANGAAARQRYLSLTETGQQWPQHQDRGSHGAHQFVRRLKGLNGAWIDLDIHPLVDDQLNTHSA